MAFLESINQRVLGFKFGFSELDIRYRGEMEVVYLSPSQDYPVPNLGLTFKRGFHWPREPEITKVLISNSQNNNPHMPGGLLPRLTGFKKAVILGPGRPEVVIKDPPEDCLVLGLGWSLRSASLPWINYYISNNPFKESLQFLPEGVELPPGIFSYGVSPEFIRGYKSLQFFYGSGWEVVYPPLYLVDLIDPLSVAFSLIFQTSIQKVVLVNYLSGYNQPLPGTVQIGEIYLYPQQVLSLSLLSALIFWTRRNGRDVYIHDKIGCSSIPQGFGDLREEDNDARRNP